MQKYLSS